MSNRGFVRGRVFLGFLILFAAVIAWCVSLMMSPHGGPGGEDPDHVRTVVATFIFKSAVGTLLLCALAGWLLWPLRRAPNQARDWTIVGVIAVLVLTSLYQLIWIGTSVLN